MAKRTLEEHLVRLRRRGRDDELVEVKAAGGGLPTDVWASVSAFANTDGGTVILGLDESRGFTPVKSFDATALLNALRAGLSRSPQENPKVTPVPEYTISEAEVDGADVIVLEILPLDAHVSGPCYVSAQGIRRGSYRRVGDADVRLSDYEIYLLQVRHQADRTDTEVVAGRGLEDLSTDLIAGALGRLRRSGSHALDGIDRDDIAGALTRLNALTDGAPTLAAYLALGTYPQQEFSHLVIDVAVHPTAERSEDPTVRFTDRRVCDGPIPLAVQDALEVTMRHLGSRRVIRGAAGVDDPEIPEDVLREAITNAVMHRDYSRYARVQSVVVDIFPDRVEVTSPGGFWGDRSAQTVLDNPTSAARNDTLAALLRTTPIPGESGVVAEDRGSGIPRMLASLRRCGLPDPDYSASTLDRVVVRLTRPAGMAVCERQPSSADLTTAERAVLLMLSTTDPLTMREISARSGRSVAAARRTVRDLVARGLVVATAGPQSRHRAYLLATPLTSQQSSATDPQ